MFNNILDVLSNNFGGTIIGRLTFLGKNRKSSKCKTLCKYESYNINSTSSQFWAIKLDLVPSLV